MNIRKKIIKIIPILLILFSLCGCGYSPSELATIEKYKIQGKINAGRYIKEKYGFEPTVLNVKNKYDPGGPIPDFSPMPTGIVIATMEYRGKKFEVKISGASQNTDGADNYQKDEIIKYLEDYVMDAYPEVDGAAFPQLEDEYSYFEEYFTGDNFFDYVDEDDYNSHIVVKLCNKDVKDFPIDDFLENIPCYALSVINYKSKEVMPTPEYFGFFSDSQLAGILPYITQYRYYSQFYAEDHEPEMFEIYSTTYDNLIICSPENEPITIEKMDKATPDEMAEKGYLMSYHLQTNADDVYVYMPKTLVNKDSTIKIKAGKYEELTYENEEFVYFDNLAVKDDTEDYETSFRFSMFEKINK